MGYRRFGEIISMLPRPQSWLNPGGGSWLYGWIEHFTLWSNLPGLNESRVGLGLVTTLIVIVGLAKERRAPRFHITWLVVFSLPVLATTLCSSWTLWHFVYWLVPGGRAIRSVARISILMLIPAGIGLAAWFERARKQRLKPWYVVPLALLVMLEQGQSTMVYGQDEMLVTPNRIERALRAEKNGCSVFLFSPESSGPLDPSWVYQLDAMWASTVTGIPTVNGYSGNRPLDWPFEEIKVTNPADKARIASDYLNWTRRPDLKGEKPCWIRLENVHPEL